MCKIKNGTVARQMGELERELGNADIRLQDPPCLDDKYGWIKKKGGGES